jgi:phosphoribosylglycinamide formyltransferase-1
LSNSRCRAAILISGSGSNLQSFIDQVADGRLDLEIAIVLSNRPDAFGLQRAAIANIASVCIEHAAFEDRESFDRAIANELDEKNVDLLILAGFMRILSPWFVKHYEGRILNIHPALLPAYPGLNTHQRVLDAGDEWHGSTVHFVTEELDGGPLVLQGRLPVRADQTATDLAARVQAIEHRIYPEAARLFAQGDLRFDSGNAVLGSATLSEPLRRDFE